MVDDSSAMLLPDDRRTGARIERLHELRLLDTAATEAFDRLTRLASKLMGAPVSLVSLVDEQRQWFKSAHGLDIRETPLSHSFCRHVVDSGEPLVVADAREDVLLRDNGAVRDLGVVAYAGMPLVTAEGVALGSFCVIDGAPRDWTADELEILRELARSAMTEIELHAARLAAERRGDELEQAVATRTAELQAANEALVERERETAELAGLNAEIVRALESMDEHVFTAEFLDDGTYVVHRAGPGIERFLGAPSAVGLGPAAWAAAIHPDDRPLLGAMRAALMRGEGHELRYRLIGVDGRTRHVLERCRLREDRGARTIFDGVVVDVTELSGADERGELAERRRDAAFHASPTGIALLASGSRVVDVNAALAAIIGHSRDELVGSDLLALAHAEDREHLAVGARRAHADGQAFETERRFVHRDGHDVWARVHITHVPTTKDDERLYLVQVQDVTEAREAESRLRRSEERYRAIFETAVDGVVTVDRQGLITSLNPATEEIFGYAGGELLGRPVTVLMPADLRKAHLAGFARFLAGGAPRLVGRGAVEVLGRRRDGSAFPMALSVGSMQIGDELSLVAVIRDVTAAKRAEAEKVALALAGLRALASAIDAKDPSTRRHSDRVADLAARIAVELGWTAERAEALRQAGLVHDVGKIGVADGILGKPGPLTDEEFAAVTLHAALGGRIVAGVLDDEQVTWIRHHHERVDGGGYPDRLPGPAIPDGARILALADAWDVMTSERPYKPPMTVDAAVAECERCSGTHFAPEVVAALRSIVRPGLRAAA